MQLQRKGEGLRLVDVLYYQCVTEDSTQTSLKSAKAMDCDGQGGRNCSSGCTDTLCNPLGFQSEPQSAAPRTQTAPTATLYPSSVSQPLFQPFIPSLSKFIATLIKRVVSQTNGFVSFLGSSSSSCCFFSGMSSCLLFISSTTKRCDISVG